MKGIDVVGIGNPLMDIIIKVKDDELVKLDLKKGNFHLVDHKALDRYEEAFKDKDSSLVPGGSVANTLSGLALLGGSAVFIGMTGSDEHGKIYEQKLEGGKVKSRIAKDTGSTGRVLSLVTPDSERTFITYLGSCLNLKPEHILDEDIRDAKILHIEGYQLEDPGLRTTALHAISLAKIHDTKVSIDLADPGLVTRNHKDISKIVASADILFANEEEIKALTGLAPEKSLSALEFIETLVIKLGKNGSIIRHKGKIHRTQAVMVKAVDTTGAGDMYAAAILYGLTHDIAMDKSISAASHIAARVVATIGARLQGDVSDIKKILS